MRRLNLVILKILLGYILGVILQEHFPSKSYPLLLGSSLLFVLLCSLHRLALKRRIFSLLFGFVLGMLSISMGMLNVALNDPLQQPSHYLLFQDLKEHSLIFEIKAQLKPTRYQNKYVAQLKQWDGQPATGKLLLNSSIDSLQSQFQVGQHFATHAVIQEVPRPRSPYQFDYGAYLNKQYIYGQLQLKPHELLLLEQQSNGILVWAARFRESVQGKLEAHSFTSKQLSIMNALLLGQRQGIDREMNAQYAAAGVIHILAVSGLHVGIILWLLRGITKPLSRYRWRFLRSMLIILCIWAFAFITGASPSVLRAATMFSFLELGRAVGGQNNTGNTLLYSALLLLLLNPYQLYQVGFQLSYLAVVSILWIQPCLVKLYTPKYRVTKLFWDTTTVTLSAQLGVMPVSLYYFHQFPGLFLITNLVVLPTLGILLGSGIGIIILASFKILPEKIALTYGSMIDILNNFIAWIATHDSFVFRHLSLTLLGLVAMYFCIVTGIQLLQKYRYRSLCIFFGAIMMSIGVLAYNKVLTAPSHFVIFQKSRSSLMGTFSNGELQLFTNDSHYDFNKDRKVDNYKDQHSIQNICQDKLPHLFRFKQKIILRIDSLGVYTIPFVKPDVIVLSESPNINLDRLISLYPKVQIIGDGSNYRSDIERWKATCQERKIPFHSTYEKGVFIIE